MDIFRTWFILQGTSNEDRIEYKRDDFFKMLLVFVLKHPSKSLKESNSKFQIYQFNYSQETVCLTGFRYLQRVSIDNIVSFVIGCIVSVVIDSIISFIIDNIVSIVIESKFFIRQYYKFCNRLYCRICNRQ